ncbi:hypothetical protein AAC387_Pa11g1175 [Persea americana]
MQPGSDFSSTYYNYNPPQPHLQNPNPNPNPNDLLPQTYASAPPFSNYPTASSSSSEYPPPTYSSPYPPFPQNPDPVPNIPPNPTAPSFHHPSPYPSVPFYPYDHHPTATNYPPAPSSLPPIQTPNPIPDLNSPFSALSLSHPPSYAPPPLYENPYDGGLKLERGGGGRPGGYLDENSGGYGLGRAGTRQYDQMGDHGVGLEEGVFAYDGGKAEPYGARGTGGFKSLSSSAFDDYGRSISFGKEQTGSGKIVKAVPKAETQQDVKGGVQKFRVKLLPEGGGQSTMDVLCQIGLDGIRMLDPNTSRTLRIYPLETITKWEVTNSSVYTFWAKSSVDIEPRRIRLQSNSYTTNTILDTVAAASVQLKEMGGNRIKGPSDSIKLADQPTEKRKGLANWMNFIKPGNEEKDHWVPDEAATKCTACGTDFGAFFRKHHCRNCGDIFCDKCTQGRIALTTDEQAQPVRVCDRCLAEVSHRLSIAKESLSKSAVQQSHEDLAKKLQEEMDRNRKGSSGSKSSDGSSRRMKEVACPTCTVHLQVQVPTSGSETIECGVCQHPFLVSAH